MTNGWAAHLVAYIAGTQVEAERTRRARQVMDQDLRPLLPPVLEYREGRRTWQLDTARIDDDTIAILALEREQWTAFQRAVLRALRMFLAVAEHPQPGERVSLSLSVALAEVEQERARAQRRKAADRVKKDSAAAENARRKRKWLAERRKVRKDPEFRNRSDGAQNRETDKRLAGELRISQKTIENQRAKERWIVSDA